MIKVRFLPYQAHCFAFGGFEIQTLDALDSLQGLPVEAAKLDVWSRDSGFDILHCWGLGALHLENARWAKRSGKKVVVTALVSYLEKMHQKLWFMARYASGEERLAAELARLADAVVVLNEEQAKVMRSWYRVPAERIRIIPNIVQEKYYSGSPAAFHAAYPQRDFVLCTGNVCRRKNQLALAKACVEAGMPLVLIGGVLQGEESYGAEVEAALRGRPDFLWIKELPKGSDLLASAYHASAAFALTSLREQQPISALEAAAAGKPLLLSDRRWARQGFYKNASLVEPSSLSSMSDGLLRIRERPDAFRVPPEIIAKCRKAEVGRAYADVFTSLVKG